MGCPSSATRSSITVATHQVMKKIVVSSTTKYAVPRQIEPRILELSMRRGEINLSAVFILDSCKKKVTAARTASTAFVDVEQIIFSQFSFYFLVGRYNKTLYDWSLGKQ